MTRLLVKITLSEDHDAKPRSISVGIQVSDDEKERLRWRIAQAVRKASEDLMEMVTREMAFEAKTVPWEKL